jgi:alanyl-tRNA synthetase
LTEEQRTSAIARGFGEAREFSTLTLPLTEDALPLLDPSRVVVRGSELKILSSVKIENEYDIDKPTIVHLDASGYITDIGIKFADYIIGSGKRCVDAEALKALYKLQDEALERLKRVTDAEKERKRKLREARELLKEEIEAYQKKIEALEQKIEAKSKEIARLNSDIEGLLEVIKDYARFIKAKNLVSEFIAFIVDKQRKESEDKIREKYMLEEEEEE